MSIMDWTIAPGVWPEIGPEIAASLKRIATMPLDELRAMPEPRCKALAYAPSTADIQSAVCEHFQVTRDEMMSSIQTQGIAVPRQIAMYLTRKLTRQSMKMIARSFNRDHSTVSWACRIVPNRPELAPVIARLRAELAP